MGEFGFQRALDEGVGSGLGALDGLAHGPGGLLELEGPALPDAALVGVVEAAGVHEHGFEGGGRQAGGRHLGVGRVGEAHGADLAVAPALGGDPGNGVEAVLAFGEVFGEGAFRAVGAAAVLVDEGVAPFDEVCRHLGAAQGLGVGHAPLRAGGGGFIVGGALQDDGEGSRESGLAAALPAGGGQVDVGGEADAVAHGDHDIGKEHVLLRRVGHGSLRYLGRSLKNGV